MPKKRLPAALPTPPPSSLVVWLERAMITAARDIAAAGCASFNFAEKIVERFDDNPIQEWEADRWMRGIKLRLIKMEAYFFRAGAAKTSATSLFVRNEAGLNVGLRREAITQLATFVSLVTDYGYGRARTRFESRHMDVAVYDDAGSTWIYAENKAAESTLAKLCGRLETEFAGGLPFVPAEEQENVHDDALMKAQHIISHRPRYFWALCPTRRQAYRVRYTARGFDLEPAANVPGVAEMPTASLSTF